MVIGTRIGAGSATALFVVDHCTVTRRTAQIGTNQLADLPLPAVLLCRMRKGTNVAAT